MLTFSNDILLQLNREIQELKISSSSNKAECDVASGQEQIIIDLQNRLSQMESANSALTLQNEQLLKRLSDAYGMFYL